MTNSILFYENPCSVTIQGCAVCELRRVRGLRPYLTCSEHDQNLSAVAIGEDVNVHCSMPMAFILFQLPPIAVTRGVGGCRHGYKYWDSFSQSQVEKSYSTESESRFLTHFVLYFLSFENFSHSASSRCVTTITITSSTRNSLTNWSLECPLMRAGEVFAVKNAINGRWLALASVKTVSTQRSLKSPEVWEKTEN